MGLYEFESIGPPELYRQGDVTHLERGVVGYLAKSKARGLCYISRRRREGEEKHFFEKLQGYAVSVSILKRLAAQDVEHILIVEKDTETVFEFGMAQFQNGERIEYDDLQNVVPIARAKRTWELSETTLYR